MYILCNIQNCGFWALSQEYFILFYPAQYYSQRFKYYIQRKEPAIMDIKPKKFISIQGNIGSGKSTILKIIRQNFPDLIILDEPLSSWEKVGEEQDVNLLGMYYQDPKRWGFTFQIHALFTRLKKWSEYTSMKDESVKISERSLLSDKYVFASIMKDMDLLNDAEYQIYLQCYRDMIKMQNIADVKGIIYIQCDPITCSERILRRNRQGQSSIPLDYLQKLHDKHEQWLNSYTKSFSETNQTCKSSSSANFSQSDENSQENQPSCLKCQNNDEKTHEKDKNSLFHNISNNQMTPDKRRICVSFDPHQSTHRKLLTEYERTPDKKCMSDLGKTHQDQKVLIIDNSQPINKNQIIKQIDSWIKTVFLQ